MLKGMVGSVQELAARLYAMPDWLCVESVTVETHEGRTVFEGPLEECCALPSPEEPFTLRVRFKRQPWLDPCDD